MLFFTTYFCFFEKDYVTEWFILLNHKGWHNEKLLGTFTYEKLQGRISPLPASSACESAKWEDAFPPPQPCAPGASKQDPSVLPQEMKQLNGFKMAALENTCIISFLKKNVCNDIAVKTYLSGIRETAHAMLRYEA